MNILIDIGHPAHVHMFRCFAHEMIQRGHCVLFTCRDKEFELKLLTAEQLEYVSFGKKHTSVLGKIWDLIRFNWKEIKVARRFKPDLFVSHGSITAAHASFLLGKPHITFEDTFNMEQIRLYEPFSEVILTSDYEHPLHSKRVLKYQGYNELLYLHPNRFTPNAAILQELGVKENEPYVVMRFVSWNATHDMGHAGISFENKRRAVESFSKFARVFISSESPLPDELQQYRLPTLPEKIHDVIAYASLIFGESATMVAEGAMLGVPGVYIDNTGRFYTRDIAQKYDLCFNYSESESDQLLAIEKGVDLLKHSASNEYKSKNRAQLLADKIDVTAFLMWVVLEYPKSIQQLRLNPDIQQQFK